VSTIQTDRQGCHHQTRSATRGAIDGSTSAGTASATISRAATSEARRGLSSPALALVLVASFMVVLDFSIVNVGLPSIRDALGFGGDSVQWVVTTYAITFGGLLILGGRIADMFGRRRMFVLGLLVFAAASLVAGLAGDAVVLVAARAVQGVGAAMVAPASLSLITASFAEGARRTRALGLYGATASIGFVAGQVLGGVLVQYLGWASIFLVNVPVGVAAALLARRLITNDQERPIGVQIDVMGGLLATAVVAAVVFAVSEGTALGWEHPLVVGAVALAVAGLIGFVAIERIHSHPLVDLHLLVRPGLRTAGILTFLVGAWTAGELVVLSLYLQQTLHDSPLAAGLVIAPQGLVGFLTGMTGVRLIRRLGMRPLLIAATTATGTGFLALSQLPASGHYSPLFAAVLLVGFGTVGTIFGTTVMAASGMADEDQGLVGGIVNTTRQVGAAVGVAVLVAIAEGAHARSGVSTISGDRAAMVVAAGIGLSGMLVAWFGPRSERPAATPTAITRVGVVNPSTTADIQTPMRRTA
jgi:EmrB/QacA subfamily drug resistance transporter